MKWDDEMAHSRSIGVAFANGAEADSPASRVPSNPKIALQVRERSATIPPPIA
jgi:hypothetical protein